MTRFQDNIGQLTPAEMEQLHEEFTDYQLLDESDVPNDVWEDAKIRVQEGAAAATTHRMDAIWGYLGKCKMADGRVRFGRLAKIAQIVLVIPHSNASEERVFSMVRKNKDVIQGCNGRGDRWGGRG
jgi:hypothetical protein